MPDGDVMQVFQDSLERFNNMEYNTDPLNYFVEGANVIAYAKYIMENKPWKINQKIIDLCKRKEKETMDRLKSCVKI